MADKSLAVNSRKYHHKTRRGCFACKQRRIKCDEKKPICTNCSKKSIECSFVRLVPAPVLRKLQFQRSQPDGLSIQQQPTDLRLGLFCRPHSLDFDLFNHYITHTSVLISSRQHGAEIYTTVIPKMALSNPSLGHAVLATAYGHLARTTPHTEMAAKYLTESAFHMNITLGCYSQAISNLSKENTPIVFANSVLISLYVFLSSGFEYKEILSGLSPLNRDPKLLDQLLCIAVRMIHGTRGIFSVFWKTQEWIATSYLSPVIQRHNPISDTAPHLFWARIEDRQLAVLESLWESDTSVSDQRSYVLSQALQSLRDTFSLSTRLYAMPPGINQQYSSVEPISLKDIHRLLRDAQLDDLPSVFTWYIRASAPYISILQQGDPFAVVIWAHHAILLDRACGRNWWFCDLASKFISAAELILGEERRGWLEWPLSIVGTGIGFAV